MLHSKNIATLAMLTAMAVVVMLFLRLPIMPAAPFLMYDLKDVVIVIGGFLYGPLAALAIAVAVAFAEMVTVSESGIIGLIMNIVSSAAFACTAAVIYKNNRSIDGAIIGLIAGSLITTIMMLLWNYAITPIYMGIPRAFVAEMLVPVFLPFNLIKTGLNGAIALFLYKPLVITLRKSGLYKESAVTDFQLNKGVMMGAFMLIISIVHIVLMLQIVSLLRGIG